MAPRMQDREKEIVLRLLLKHAQVIIENKTKRGGDINSARASAWEDILTTSKRLLRPDSITMTRVKSICNKAMRSIRRLGCLSNRYETMTGGGANQDIEDKISQWHATMTAAESALYERYKPSPAMRGVHRLADSMILGEAIQGERNEKYGDTVERARSPDELDPFISEVSTEFRNMRASGELEEGDYGFGEADVEVLMDEEREEIGQDSTFPRSPVIEKCRYEGIFNKDDSHNTKKRPSRVDMMNEEEILNEFDELLPDNQPKKKKMHEWETPAQSTFSWDEHSYGPPKIVRDAKEKPQSEKEIRKNWMAALEEQKQLVTMQKEFYRESLVMIRLTIQSIEKAEERQEKVAKAIVAFLDRGSAVGDGATGDIGREEDDEPAESKGLRGGAVNSVDSGSHYRK